MTKLFIPLLSLFTYVLGSHAMNIAVSFFLSVENYSQWDIGVMNSFGYLGLFFAGFYTDRLIANLGHVLAFMISACLAAFCGIVFFLDPSFYFQLIIRLSLGFIVGLMYVVIESWVLTLTPDHQRGESFSYYMVVLYLAQALSPFLLEVRFTYLKTVYLITSFFCFMSLVPMLFMKKKPQSQDHVELIPLSIFQVFNRSKLGFSGCVLSGVITGSLISLLPYYAFKKEYSVSLLMSVLITGSALFQWPFGKAADLFGRSKILMCVCISLLIPSLILVSANWSIFVVAPCIFILGALCFSIYPISIALACESMHKGELLSASKALLLDYSLGSVVGVPIISAFMDFFNNHDLLFVMISLVGLFCFFDILLYATNSIECRIF